MRVCAGKAVMYLYRHPRESKDNKARAGRIIHTWARPIFHKTDNLASMTKEDRRMKDAAVAARHTQMMSAASAAASRKRRLEEAEADAKRPGEAGWVGRARVPQVSCDWWRAGHVTTVLTCDWSAAGGGWGLLVQARVADPGGHQQDQEEGGQLPVARNGLFIVNSTHV